MQVKKIIPINQSDVACMEISKNLTDETLLKVIGERMAQIRLSKNLTQEHLAEQAGIGLRTVQRLELGTAATQLSSFVRVCPILGLVERFENLEHINPPGNPPALPEDPQSLTVPGVSI